MNSDDQVIEMNRKGQTMYLNISHKMFLLCFLVVFGITSCHSQSSSPAKTLIPMSSASTSVVIVSEWSSTLAYTSFYQLHQAAHRVVIGRVIKKDKIINSARSLTDRSQPDPNHLDIAQIYAVEVVEYIKGEGPKIIYVGESIGFINNQGAPVSTAEIDQAISKNSAERLQEGMTYLLFLYLIGDRYAKEGYAPDNLASGIGSPWRFLLTDENIVRFDDEWTSLAGYFPDWTLARVREAMNDPNLAVQTPVPVPYPLIEPATLPPGYPSPEPETSAEPPATAPYP